MARSSERRITSSKSYVIPCSSRFRDRVTTLAESRDVSVADLIRAVRLLLPAEVIRAFPDPGGPSGDDRETVVLKSGREADKAMRRKPRLQARLEPGIGIEELRKALNLSLAIQAGERRLDLEDPAVPKVDPRHTHRIEQMQEEIDRLRLILTTLAFDPLPHGVRTRGDALYVLGFQPSARPDRRTIQAKYRMLALIFHPDANTGDTERMAQLNDAVKTLRTTALTA